MLGGIVPILVVLGVVIFIHELGHFVAAKIFGVYAPRFSIGFGPALWKRRFGETEYRVAVLPLGGYVRMASRDDEAMAALEGGGETGRDPGAAKPKDWDPEAMVPFGPKPVPAHRWFESKPVAARVVILLAGVTMNFLLAVVVTIAVVAIWGRGIIPTRVVGLVRPAPGAASLPAKIAVGDTILAVDGKTVAHWGEVDRALATGPASRLVIRTNRGEFTFPDSAGARLDRPALLSSIDVLVPPVIDTVIPGGAAAGAGIRSGDSVTAVDRRPIRSWAEMVAAVSSRPGDTIRLGIARADSSFEVALRTRVAVEGDRRVGKVGVGPKQIARRERVPLGEAVVIGWRVSIGLTGEVLGVLKGLVFREVSVKQLGGPIAIARASVQAARVGLDQFMMLLAYISINLAILNLLPIPILDGGQVLMVLAEGVKGSALSLRTREILLKVGLLVILLLFIIVTYNDILRLFGLGSS